LAVVKDGEVILRKSYGLASVEFGVPISGETVFDVASVAKQFTGFAIAKLVAAGSLSLEDNVRTFIPELPEWGSALTIEQLVHHTGGVSDWPYTLQMSGIYLQDDLITFEQILHYIYHQEALKFTPGSRMEYSNAGYNLLAEIIARVSGQTFPEWMAENVFVPLGMRHSQVRPNPRHIIKKLANPYYVDEGVITTGANQLTAYGSSSLFSTVDDLLLWVDGLENGRLGTPEFLQTMHRVGRLNDGSETNYAFGVGVLFYRGLKFIAHSGQWLAYTSTIQRFPEQRSAIIVLSNASHINAAVYGSKIANILMAEDFTEPYPRTAEAADPVAHAEPQGDWGTESLDDFTGKFGFEAVEGYVTSVRRDADRLLFTFTNEPETAAVRRGESVFYLPSSASTITFQRDADGTVNRLILNRDDDYTANRMEAYVPLAGELRELEGMYYSSELGAAYTFFMREGELFTRHSRKGEVRLKALAEDQFGDGPSWFSGAKFVRNGEAEVTGVVVTGEGSNGVLFRKAILR
jgi:CubicO group peptidase (beta-lactamase class C family)